MFFPAIRSLSALGLLLVGVTGCGSQNDGYARGPSPNGPAPGQWNGPGQQTWVGPPQAQPGIWGQPVQPGPPQPGQPQSYPPGQWNPNSAPPAQPAFPGLPQIPGLPAPSAFWPTSWGAPPLQFPQAAPGQPSSPPQGPGPQPASPGGGASDPSQRCVDEINRYRAGLGVPALQRWASAEPCASSQGENGYQTKQPHGAFGKCSEMAQNVCPNWPGPADSVTLPCLKSMYDEGPGADFEAHGHYINMTNPKYQQVACGYFTAPSGSIWLVQDFK